MWHVPPVPHERLMALPEQLWGQFEAGKRPCSTHGSVVKRQLVCNGRLGSATTKVLILCVVFPRCASGIGTIPTPCVVSHCEQRGYQPVRPVIPSRMAYLVSSATL